MVSKMNELTKNKLKYNAARAGKFGFMALGGVFPYAFIATALYLFEKAKQNYVEMKNYWQNDSKTDSFNQQPK
jgi:hypothetical protein